jgi:hypothetical protein
VTGVQIEPDTWEPKSKIENFIHTFMQKHIYQTFRRTMKYNWNYPTRGRQEGTSIFKMPTMCRVLCLGTLHIFSSNDEIEI